MDLETGEMMTGLELDTYEVPALPKQIDNRGYIYVLYDTAFPDYIKVGRTINVKKRLAQYNSDRPVATASIVAVSQMFDDANWVEKRILDHLSQSTPPNGSTKEWFAVDRKYVILDLIEEAEKFFEE